MSDSDPTTAADVAALAAATDAHGRVDFTAFEAQRRILRHQSIDGLDAQALVQGLVAAPVYATPEGRAQIGPLLAAIHSRVSAEEANRFMAALDAARVPETPGDPRLGRHGCGLSRGLSANAEPHRGVRAGDTAPSSPPALRPDVLTDQLWLARAAAAVGIAGGAARAQALERAANDRMSRALGLLNATVDVATLQEKLQGDRNICKAIIGFALVLAFESTRALGALDDDVHRVGWRALDAWRESFDRARDQSVEHDYMASIEGRAGLGLLALVLPDDALGKLGRFARVVDDSDDLAPRQ